jgi:hypothetical protein
MENNNEDKKMAGLGYLQDDTGGKSSGRLMKIMAVCMAILPGLVMLVLGSIKFIGGELGYTEFGTQMFGIIGIYAGLAGLGEITQKVTGK